ncbi:MAG: ATP-binding cassette domain-containing protein [Candidatus Diapherotrites archaeon]|nr:ATP-binding cassette domain-containing protein [Candidatus Diapherotrites archaeon]
MIDTKELTKRFGELTAVKSIELHIQEGEIFGLLGPNGAGKTTTISMLSTILTPTSGTAIVAGHNVATEREDVRKDIGVVFQDPSLDDELTGYENLEFHGRLYGMSKDERKERIVELLELVELIDKKDIPVKNYSGGMKRRLEIARGLMHKPRVLFLDEPTIGLDPQTRRYIWKYIKEMNAQERVTVLVTTHYMEEADYLCDKVAIIDHGEIIALDKPSRLKSKMGKSVISMDVSKPDKFCELVRKSKWVIKSKCVGDKVHLTVKDGEKLIPKLVILAEKNGLNVNSITMHSPTLEDVFIQLTGRHLREEQASSTDALRKRFMARRGH